MFTRKKFIVLHFTFRCMINLSTLVTTCKDYVEINFCAYACPIVISLFVKKTIFSSLDYLCKFVKNHFHSYALAISNPKKKLINNSTCDCIKKNEIINNRRAILVY